MMVIVDDRVIDSVVNSSIEISLFPVWVGIAVLLVGCGALLVWVSRNE
jgi:hypothetical protein